MEKNELVKGFKTIIEDLLDNYDKYTDEEKAKVKEIFLNASELNAILDKYDVEHKIDWDKYFTLAGKYFDSFH
jgi:hypothetical protein